MAKSDAHQKLLLLLCNYNTGDKISQDVLSSHMNWKPKTLKTYVSKQMLATFLIPDGAGHFKVLRDGNDLTLKDVEKSFSQAKEKPLVLTPGEKLSGKHQYILDGKLGSGAVAQVWRAHRRYPPDTGLTDVAIKVVDPRPDLLDPTILENIRTRFARESRNGAKMDHPQVVNHLDFGKIGEHFFLVMELAEESAKNTLDRSGPLPIKAVSDILLKCVLGLKYLHNKNCIHRDIKPANILRTSRGYVLGDLGIVQWSDLNSDFTDAGTVTRESVQLGSWFYMAPEQQRNSHTVTSQSDIYALGVTAYELLTGHTPSPAEIGARMYRPPSNSERLNTIIDGMLNFAPENRPTLDEIEDVLKQL